MTNDVYGNLATADEELLRDIEAMVQRCMGTGLVAEDSEISEMAGRCQDEEQAMLLLSALPMVSSPTLLSFVLKLRGSGVLDLGPSPFDSPPASA